VGLFSSTSQDVSAHELAAPAAQLSTSIDVESDPRTGVDGVDTAAAVVGVTNSDTVCVLHKLFSRASVHTI
jgi:hypothetical protein